MMNAGPEAQHFEPSVKNQEKIRKVIVDQEEKLS